MELKSCPETSVRIYDNLLRAYYSANSRWKPEITPNFLFAPQGANSDFIPTKHVKLLQFVHRSLRVFIYINALVITTNEQF